jgi:hypothetical protein
MPVSILGSSLRTGIFGIMLWPIETASVSSSVSWRQRSPSPSFGNAQGRGRQPVGRQAATAQPGDAKMSSRTTLALAAAIVLGAASAASAATVHRRAGSADPAVTAGTIAIGNAGGTITTGYCPPSGGPSCSTACLPSGPPCKPGHDTW